MPVITLGSKVLVTGANSFLGMWIVRKLLEKGYAVKGAVRSVEKANYLQEFYKLYGDKFDTVVVEDITKDGAFDEAIKGIDAVAHVASPMVPPNEDPDAYIKPAVEGTLSILKSIVQPGATVKRIIYTSSTGTIVNSISEPVTLNESNWNEDSVKEVNEKGKEAGRMAMYLASKTLAEKAAWKFYEEHKHAAKWDLVVINPPVIFGPTLQAVSSPSSLNPSMAYWYSHVIADTQKQEGILKKSSSWIDVRDAAEAHVLALEKENAAGERIIVSAGRATWQEFIDIANTVSPVPALSRPLPRGVPGIEKHYIIKFDTAKAEKILEMKYLSIEQMIKDILQDFVKHGW